MSSKIVNHLHRHGIDFLVPESDIEGWLSEPDITSYRPISELLLTLLEGKRLLQPVLLENIVFNYEITPGVQSPRSSSEVNTSLLKAAVLKSYCQRYGEDINDFDKIIWNCIFGK